MYKDKKVLLIAGGGTLGSYTAKELLRLGCTVDIVCPEEKISNDERLTFYQSYATEEFLTQLFKEKRYDGIINFVMYKNIDEYKPIHKLLTDNTDHLIFISSYRVYADLEHPITEKSPLLLDTSTDKEFLAKEDYAIPKAKAEKFIREESKTKNWTIVRPVISFSDKRLDVVLTSGRTVFDAYKEGKTIYLPEISKNVTAGLDWAGNSGKLIANLLFKKEALQQAFTISSAPNLTWGEVAQLYTELIGTKFEWIDTDEWLKTDERALEFYWATVYDRFFDRLIDNSKVLSVTGLTKDDFLSIKEGIIIEIGKILEQTY